MRHLYTFLLYSALPFVLLRLLWRSLKTPDYRKRWRERLGLFDPLGASDTLWIHAVSVGEVQAAVPLVKLLQDRYPGQAIVITTTTPTGSRRVKELFGDDLFHVYAPYDLPLIIERFIRRTRPRIVVLMETEIWPNLLVTCKRHGIPSLLANARLSRRSAKGYARLGGFARQTFGNISQVAAQAAADAERFVQLGVDPARIQVTGSIKFDARLPRSLNEQAEVIRRTWGHERPVWVAASTHEGEDELVLQAHRQIRQQLPDALLVLVPRHPERFDRVAALCQKSGFSVVRRSDQADCTAETGVFLGDSVGELPMFLAGADVAFMGGSLVKHGGHNMLEPAALGVPVVFGPHNFNFAAISELLLEADAAVMVRYADELATVVEAWLGDASERSRIGENGRWVVEQNRGALDKLAELMDELLRACQ
ncbi:MAG: lipid IV(A) 3-deoxy-D-manno-octulosonic acid transferase [Candidatus Polarisedimenticolaceae bacterium]|nr:lipid IV(A) 3-deoxy-D-manno-octulosonic acid transferase [Candidatus Polarisedimenticolaceae bacterium]